MFKGIPIIAMITVTIFPPVVHGKILPYPENYTQFCILCFGKGAKVYAEFCFH